MNSTDHAFIWLEPKPPKDTDMTGRTWCQNDEYRPDDYDGAKPTLYVRADLEPALGQPAKLVECLAALQRKVERWERMADENADDVIQRNRDEVRLECAATVTAIIRNHIADAGRPAPDRNQPEKENAGSRPL